MDNIFNNIDKKINEIADTPISNRKLKFKNQQPKTITIFSKPKTYHVKLNKEDINKIKKNILGKELIKFRKKLYKNFKSENLNILNNNIKTLKVKIKYIAPEILLSSFVSGEYKFKKNKIKLIKYYKDDSINHELFHMASSFYDKKYKLSFCGFHQIDCNKKKAIGYGLNEGYTELLTNRYFNEEKKFIVYSYKICTFFATKLEEIVGKEQMEKFYITADLYGLYMFLVNYDDRMNVATFIALLDYIVAIASISNLEKIKEYYELIECYLAKWYINKKKQELDNNIINKETFEQEITNYINSLGIEELNLKNYVKQKEYCLK